MGANKDFIDMNVLELVCEYTFPETRMRVVVDGARPVVFKDTQSLKATVLDFYNAPFAHKTINYMGGKTEFGALWLPDDDNIKKTLNLKPNDKIRIFFDGRHRSDTRRVIAISTCQAGVRGQQMFINPIPYADADINNFMHRYLPRMGDKVKFNWAMIKTILSHRECPHFKPSDNLRHVLKYGVYDYYLAQLARSEKTK